MKQAWHHFLKFGDFGQQVSLLQQPDVCLGPAAQLVTEGLYTDQ